MNWNMDRKKIKIIALCALADMLLMTASMEWRVPIVLDSVGTIAVALLLGPLAGMVTGVLSGVLIAITWGFSGVPLVLYRVILAFFLGGMMKAKMRGFSFSLIVLGIPMMLFLATIRMTFYATDLGLSFFNEILNSFIAYKIICFFTKSKDTTEIKLPHADVSQSTDEIVEIFENRPSYLPVDRIQRVLLGICFLAMVVILLGMLTLSVGKPVIYLYPEKRITVGVSLDFEGKLTHTYPSYGDGWTVTASPDSTLINHADNKEYSYLFWEGTSQRNYDQSTGFVVKGSDTAVFLQETLAEIGLLPKEYNEFIVYWLPHMENNRYNLITFQEKDYTDSAKLTITPQPDSVLRVFMTFKPLQFPVSVPPQQFKPFTRKGFTVVEWGGAEIR